MLGRRKVPLFGVSKLEGTRENSPQTMGFRRTLVIFLGGLGFRKNEKNCFFFFFFFFPVGFSNGFLTKMGGINTFGLTEVTFCLEATPITGLAAWGSFPFWRRCFGRPCVPLKQALLVCHVTE